MPRVETPFNRGPITPRRRQHPVDAADTEADPVMPMPRYPNRRLDRMIDFRRSDPGIFAILTDDTQRAVEQYAVDRAAALTGGRRTRSMTHGRR